MIYTIEQISLLILKTITHELDWYSEEHDRKQNKHVKDYIEEMNSTPFPKTIMGIQLYIITLLPFFMEMLQYDWL